MTAWQDADQECGACQVAYAHAMAISGFPGLILWCCRTAQYRETGVVSDEPVPYPVDGILDLHVFNPRDVKNLVSEYLWACRQKGILRVRIIHGKGRSVLRKTVHAVLDREEAVLSYTKAGDRSGWGATIVHLSPC